MTTKVDTSPGTYRFLPAEVFTSSYRLTGKIMVASTGAFGLLNDTTHSVLEMYDTSSSPIAGGAGTADHFEMVRVVKGRVHLVCFARREDLGPQALLRGGYTGMVENPARFVTSVYEIEAIVESQGRFDFTMLVTEGSRDFLPLYSATVIDLRDPGVALTSGGVLINRRHVDLAGLLNQRATAPAAGAA